MAFYTIFWNNCVLETYRNMNSHVYKGCLHFFSFKFQQSENLYINTPGRVKQVTGFIKIMQCTWEYNQILATISFFYIKTWRTFVNSCDLWSWNIIIQFSYKCTWYVLKRGKLKFFSKHILFTCTYRNCCTKISFIWIHMRSVSLTELG